MTGTFELLVNSRGYYEFRLLSLTGKVLAVSGPYPDRDSAVAAIALARESAAMARINDQTAQPATPPACLAARPGSPVSMVWMRRGHSAAGSTA
ncbi:YegP family protein [Sinomonas terrae]|uniref:DUF1508 domain-containing protein n=1 Tax=Sinomonas terrae TaxID=2908838 RepID=A0ABS9U713_9MICC|nr:DUF1508 domain-containing protein [Sinomonas terrae]MCH6472498.1 DUF1508 domain-containing protein [Sinomonas terrae]